MRRGKYGVLVLPVIFFIFLLTPAALGLSLRYDPLGKIVYTPGLTASYRFVVEDTSREVTAEVDTGSGPLRDYIYLSNISGNEFYLNLRFPVEARISPGIYDQAVTVKEKPANEGTISTTVAVSKKFSLIVYTWEKEVNLGLEVPNVNEGDLIRVALGVQSVTYSNIDSIYGVVSIFNENKLSVASVTTTAKPLPSLESFNWKEIIERKLPIGEYVAKAVVFYDGQREEVNTSFLVGNMDVIVKNYTTTLRTGFDEFRVEVRSNWGKTLRNVYGLLSINGTHIMQTPSINLEPWTDGVLQSIVKIDFSPSTYPGKLEVFFEGTSKVVPVTITIMAPAAEPAGPEEQPKLQRPWPSTLIGGALSLTLLAIVLISIYLIRKKKKRGDEFEK